MELESVSLRELRRRAAEHGIRGRSTMTRAALVDALRAAARASLR
ncbi:Rho termination factor N-terminal domain-containing protein [Pengzhenrongella sicca]|uniref:Rho termination factor N-terminal domain-containing protein n=1 Tax=Pengzhenrongella sicca TaxID=2819238 RepID=A0A8A4ZI21_9MICO|nr:Rho termination factor N-terminal domain-containing protein [Pengzhenrongella sicca]QTE30633.1 Rho termination factor N-terminal domain-containing protein [Pengzhenrongella sicca]